MRSLRAILEPRSLAVVGVSSRAESLSTKLLASIAAAGYRGAVYPINPRATEIVGLPCFPSVRATPEVVDLAVVMVSRDAVAATVGECLDAGVSGLVVITAGFREGGQEGAAAERALLARLRGSGVRMLGPNCMGVINTAPGVSLDATFSPTRALPGAVAFAAHSGALGVAVLEGARERRLGFSQFVSLGNSADVNVCDVLEWWEHDESTRVIMLYLEAVEEPRRFLACARRLTRRKPVVVMKAGRTAAGQRAASSHTGALAAADTAVEALFRQAGVLRAATLEEMIDLALALQACPLPRGGRVAVVSNAGGPAIAATDALAANGLELAHLAAATTEALRSLLPAEAAVGNPVDMLPSATPQNYSDALELVVADDGVDAAVAITVTPPMTPPLRVAETLAALAPTASKPLLSVFMSSPAFYAAASALAGLPPVYRFPENAVRAVGGLLRQARCAARREAADPTTVVKAFPALPSATSSDGCLGPAEAFGMLEGIGIPVAPWRLVGSLDGVVASAAELGFPVVLKAHGEGLVHKSELGAVAVGLRDARELATALAGMEARLAAAGLVEPVFLVQRQVAGGREVIVGVTRDPAMGPLVMCGLGGVAVELWQDVSFRLAPVSATEANEMIDELRGAALLGAFRGRPPADRAAFADAIVRLAALAAAHPELAECDINPLLLLAEGAGCVAVDVRARLTV